MLHAQQIKEKGGNERLNVERITRESVIRIKSTLIEILPKRVQNMLRNQ